jgi:two-component SAPR family response regulator
MGGRWEVMGKRVLIVEDDALFADHLSALVEDRLDCVPLVTDNVQDAMALVDVDFGFIDIELPDGLAFVVAGSLRERGVPFVFVSASDPACVPAELSDAPFLRKPVAVPTLLEAARAHL